MKTLVAIIMALAPLVTFAQASPAASIHVEIVRSLAFRHDLDDAILVAESARRENKEDHIVLGCITWTLHKITALEASGREKFTREQMEKYLSDTCDIGNESGAVLESDELAETISERIKSNDGRKEFNETPTAVIPHIRGMLRAGHEMCSEFIGMEFPMCRRMDEAARALEIFPARIDR